MSINRLEIRNFQSLRQVDLDLGQFTVIVGPSSSGKSALIRAVRALASNVRGPAVITRGQTTMAITARTDTHAVTLERSERHGAYKIVDLSGAQQTFTKLAGDVPPQVTDALGIEPVAPGAISVNFASQFDKPYLLDESGATIARQLGELTNVNQVFEAVRAANRIRAAAASKLKTRKDDLEQVRTKLKAFQGLSDRLRALREVEQADEGRRNLTTQITRLQTALKTIRVAQLTLTKVAVVPEIPQADQLSYDLARYRRLTNRLDALRAAQAQARRAQDAYQALSLDLPGLEDQLRDKLANARVCPTCGQTTTG